MHVEVSQDGSISNFSLDAPTPSPTIRVNEADIGGRWDIEACRIEVEKENGEFSRFWVSVRVENGRPKVYVTTKTGKLSESRTQVQKSITGTFNQEPLPSRILTMPWH